MTPRALTAAPPSAPQGLKEISRGSVVGGETLLANPGDDARPALEASQAAVLVTFSQSDFQAATARFAGAVSAMAEMRKRRSDALSPAGMVGHGIQGVDVEELRAFADMSRSVVLFPGDAVFGPGREDSLAIVLWGSVTDPT